MSGLTRYITIRLFSLVAAMLVVSVVAFILLRLMPGDPATAMLPPDAQLWEYEALRERLGLNEPLPIQFARYLERIVRLDFGNSLFYREVCVLEGGAQEDGDNVPCTVEFETTAQMVSSTLGSGVFGPEQFVCFGMATTYSGTLIATRNNSASEADPEEPDETETETEAGP